MITRARIAAVIALLAAMYAQPRVRGDETAAPTWSRDVRGIIEAHCTDCHHAAGPAPFALVTSGDVARRAEFVSEVTRRRIMPPSIAATTGEAIQGHRALSDRDIEVLAAWAKRGAPVGVDDLPAAIPSEDGARADVVIEMPEPWTIPAEGGENWGRRDRDKWTFAMPIGNVAPLRVQAMTHQTSAPTAVHAVSYLADTSGLGRWSDERFDGPGSYMTGDVRDHPTGEIGTTGVGARTARLPEGFHWHVPAAADLIMEVHYRPSGRPHDLKDTLSLELAADEDSRPVRSLVSMIRKVDVPPHEAAECVDEFVLPEDVTLVGLTPRAMGVCTGMRIEADIPGEGEAVILDLPDYDPHWRRMCMLETPRFLPAGTVIRTSWTIANTEDNPRNPFLPIERLSMARRTGAVSALIHVAADDEAADERLQQWHGELMRARVR